MTTFYSNGHKLYSKKLFSTSFVKDSAKKPNLAMLEKVKEKLAEEENGDVTTYTLFFKLASITWKETDKKVIARGIEFLSRAYCNGELIEEFVDPDVPGTPQADIQWVRCCHYFVKLGSSKKSAFLNTIEYAKFGVIFGIEHNF